MSINSHQKRTRMLVLDIADKISSEKQPKHWNLLPMLIETNSPQGELKQFWDSFLK